MKAAQWTDPQEATPVFPFLNPDPVACLVGWSSEAPVIIDGQKVTMLINSGAQVSIVSSGFCECMNLEVDPLGKLLELDGTGGSAIPYQGHIEVNLHIPSIKGYNEDILLLVILIMIYSEVVLVMVRSKIIDCVMGMITKGEHMRATATWKQVHFGAVMSGSLQLPYTDSKERWRSGEGDNPLPKLWPYSVQGFCLDDVQWPVHTTQKVTLPPFGTIGIHGNTGIHGQYMWVLMLAEPAWGPQLPTSMVLTATYRELHPGSSWVPICLRKPECLPHRSLCQGNCWQAHSGQPGTASGPPNGDLRIIHPQLPERMDPGGVEPLGPRGVAWAE